MIQKTPALVIFEYWVSCKCLYYNVSMVIFVKRLALQNTKANCFLIINNGAIALK